MYSVTGFPHTKDILNYLWPNCPSLCSYRFPQRTLTLGHRCENKLSCAKCSSFRLVDVFSCDCGTCPAALLASVSFSLLQLLLFSLSYMHYIIHCHPTLLGVPCPGHWYFLLPHTNSAQGRISPLFCKVIEMTYSASNIFSFTASTAEAFFLLVQIAFIALLVQWILTKVVFILFYPTFSLADLFSLAHTFATSFATKYIPCASVTCPWTNYLTQLNCQLSTVRLLQLTCLLHHSSP